jgi:polyisoprenoid-binding protein YceI
VNAPSSAKRRRGPAVIAAMVLLPVAALVAVYLLFFTPDSPDKLTLDDVPLTTVAGAPATTVAGSSSGSGSTLEGTWSVASGSQAGYRVREKLAALPATSDAVGRTESVTGTFTVKTAGDKLVADGVTVEVDVSTLKSDETRRDNRIRTDGLQSNQFPKATFTSSGPVTLPDNTAAGDQVTADVNGKLTIHGVTKDVTIPLTLQLVSGQGRIAGSLKFPFSDFGMSPPSVGGFVTVESDATLEFALLLAPA